MTPPRQRLAILGSTGSVGTSTLDVVARHPDRFEVVGLSSNQRVDLLVQQCLRWRPRVAVLPGPEPAAELRRALREQGSATEVHAGAQALCELAEADDVDSVMAAIVGAAGLPPCIAAARAGKRLLLANKEALVVGGGLFMRAVAEGGANLLPIDSEHSAVFQCLPQDRGAWARHIDHIVLTASGGPFRRRDPDTLHSVTPAQAVAHPNWVMGQKISVDSATMMNKALEIIEARWLFGVSAEQIEVVVHPQSIVHSMVEFCDGSTIAQLSPPDMRLPIQYALTYPERWTATSASMDWSRSQSLTFQPPDLEAFPALRLGFEVARQGGTAGAVLNAANEVAVDRFLQGRLRFLEIADACRDVLNSHTFDANPTLTDLLRQDQWARREMLQWKSSLP